MLHSVTGLADELQSSQGLQYCYSTGCGTTRTWGLDVIRCCCWCTQTAMVNGVADLHGACSIGFVVAVQSLAANAIGDQCVTHRVGLTVFAGTIAAGNLDLVTGLLQEAGVHFESWIGTPYSSDAHLEERGLLS